MGAPPLLEARGLTHHLFLSRSRSISVWMGRKGASQVPACHPFIKLGDVERKGGQKGGGGVMTTAARCETYVLSAAGQPPGKPDARAAPDAIPGPTAAGREKNSRAPPPRTCVCIKPAVVFPDTFTTPVCSRFFVWIDEERLHRGKMRRESVSKVSIVVIRRASRSLLRYRNMAMSMRQQTDKRRLRTQEFTRMAWWASW